MLSDVVGFMVRQVTFEKVEIPIDSVDQADPLSQQEVAPIPPAQSPFDAIGVLVVDIGSGHHRIGLLGLADILEAEANSSPSFLKNLFLRARRFFRRVAVTRKPPWYWNNTVGCVPTSIIPENLGGFRAFS